MKDPVDASQPLLGPSGDTGFVLALTLQIMLLLSALGVALLTLSSAEIVQGRLSQDRLRAFNLAEAGEVYARRALSLDMDLDGNGIDDQTQVFTDSQRVTWDSTPQLATLQAGSSGSVTILPHSSDPDSAVITSTARLGHSTKTIEVITRRQHSIPPGVRGAITANGPIETNGTISVDGRDHTINGNLIPRNGTAGIYAASSYSQGGASKVGGTDAGGVDHQPTRPGDPSVVETNVTEPMPGTPDEVMGGTLNGFPEGTLKWIAQSGMNGSQYVTDPAALRFPLSGVTYVELPPGKTWAPAFLGDGSGILVVHNSAGNAVIKNINPSGSSCDCFRGLLIADDIVHIHATITGAVVSLTTGPSSGNVIGNGSGKVLFSRAALAAAGNLFQKIWPVYSWREIR